MSSPYFGIDIENLKTNIKILHLQPEFGIILIQNDKIIYANHRFQEIIEISEEELKIFDVFKLRERFVHSDDIKDVETHYSKAMGNKIGASATRHEYRIQMSKDNRIKWIQLHSIKIEYENQDGLLSLCLDITKLKEIENQYSILLKAVDTANDAILITDNKEEPIFSNKAYKSLFSESRLPKDKITTINKEEFSSTWETQLIRKDNTVVPIDVSNTVLKDSNANKIGVISIIRDISEKKRLEESISKLSRATDISIDAIIILNKKGKIEYCNSASLNLFGVSKEVLLNTNINAFTHPDDVHTNTEKINQLYQNGSISGWEARILRKDGKVIPIEVSTNILKDATGVMLGSISILRDISERRILQEEQMRSQQMESLSTIASGVAHDFNNLLAGLLGNIQLIKMNDVLDEENSSYLIEMEKATSRAKNLTQQLMMFAKGGNLTQNQESIQDIIENCIAIVMRGKKSICRTSFEPNIPPIYVDVGKISQVINNLLINADQAMIDGGIIEIFVNNAIPEEIKKYLLPPKKYVKISVKDHGMGIPDEIKTKIFTPYFTTKPTGTGLGLATSYSILKQHMGYIGFESELHKGTTFFLFLPIAEEVQKIKQNNVPQIKKYSGTCLLMDDDEIFLKSLEQILSKMGFKTEAVVNGHEAINKYHNNLLQKKPFDIVILDYLIPGDIGGKDASIEILKSDPNAKIVISTGSNDETLQDFVKTYGINGILFKPYSMEEIQLLFDQILKN